MYTSPLNRVVDYVCDRPTLLVACVLGLWIVGVGGTVLVLSP